MTPCLVTWIVKQLLLLGPSHDTSSGMPQSLPLCSFLSKNVLPLPAWRQTWLFVFLNRLIRVYPHFCFPASPPPPPHPPTWTSLLVNLYHLAAVRTLLAQKGSIPFALLSSPILRAPLDHDEDRRHAIQSTPSPPRCSVTAADLALRVAPVVGDGLSAGLRI